MKMTDAALVALGIGPLGPTELVLMLVIVVVVFGATKLPELGEGLGKGVERFREHMQRSERSHLLFERRSPRRWSLSDWLLVGAAGVLFVAVVANALLP